MAWPLERPALREIRVSGGQVEESPSIIKMTHWTPGIWIVRKFGCLVSIIIMISSDSHWLCQKHRMRKPEAR